MDSAVCCISQASGYGNVKDAHCTQCGVVRNVNWLASFFLFFLSTSLFPFLLPHSLCLFSLFLFFLFSPLFLPLEVGFLSFS